MTGSIQTTPTQVIKNMTSDALQLTFVSSAGSEIKAGQEVYQHTDGTVKKRTLGTQIPLGIALSDTPDGERVLVRVPHQMVIEGIAKGGALNAGVAVVPDGTLNADGYPNYVAAGASAYVSAFTLKAAVEDARVCIGIIQGVYLTPGA